MTQATTPKQTHKADPQRLLAFEALKRCLNNSKRFQVDNFLSMEFQKQNFTTEQRHFTTHLAYSLCRYWFAMDPILSQWLKKPLEKLDSRTQILLKMGLIQLSSVCETPNYAAVESTLSVAQAIGFDKPRRGFLTAVLQNAARQSEEWTLNPENMLPVWLLENKPGLRQATLKALDRLAKGIGIRINTLKITVEEFKNALDSGNIPYEHLDETAPSWILLAETRHADQIPGYQDGWFLPQDFSAFQVALLLAPEANESILEIGAAPGGKTGHIAALMNNSGSILALDNNPKRMPLLTDNLTRLGITNTTTQCLDICTESLDSAAIFDRILIDAPCSASGIIRRHPDVLLQLTPKDMTAHNAIQLTLLEKSWPHLKYGGTLVYATCSLFETENEDIIRQFMAKTPDASLIQQTILLPSPQQDGFFIAKVKKIKS